MGHMKEAVKFDPPADTARYAVYFESGNRFEVVSSLAVAKIKFHGWGRPRKGKILENVGGEWFILFEIEAADTTRDLPWYKEVKRWRNRYWNTELGRYDAGYQTMKIARPMTRDEYAEWRVNVELARRGLDG